MFPADRAYGRVTLFCTIDFVVHGVKFEIEDETRDRMSRLLETT
jgi:hypothetical protein